MNFMKVKVRKCQNQFMEMNNKINKRKYYDKSRFKIIEKYNLFIGYFNVELQYDYLLFKFFEGSLCQKKLN